MENLRLKGVFQTKTIKFRFGVNQTYTEHVTSNISTYTRPIYTCLSDCKCHNINRRR